MNATEKLDTLRDCEAFASAEDSDLQWLAEQAQIEAVGPGDVVFEHGDETANVYVVVSGSLRIRVHEDAKLVSVAERSSLFGEYAMFAHGVRTARVAATEPCVLLSIDEAPFREFLLRCPTVMMELLQTAVRRLQRAERARS